METNEIAVPPSMGIVLGGKLSDRERMRRMIQLKMLGEYRNNTQIVRAGLDMLFAAMDKRLEERGE